MPPEWKIEACLFLGITGAAGTVGALTGLLAPALVCGLLIYIGWHLYQLIRLHRSFGKDANSHTGAALGLWKNLHAEINRSLLAERSHAQGLTHLLSRFQAAVTTLPDAVIILNKQGMIDWCNPAAETLLGLRNAVVAGQNFSMLVNDPVLTEHLTARDYNQPLIFQAPASKSRLLSLLAVPLVDEQQMLVISDITREYHLDEVRRDFVANVSHELRTPLTVISGLLEQHAMGGMDETTRRRTIDMMQQQTERMRELITDLLTLSRLESKDGSLRRQHVDVPALLGEIIDNARALSVTSGHMLQLNLHSSASLLGNVQEIRAAFSNLVTNAIKHTPNRSIVEVTWSVDSMGAHLSVQDTGGGIAARHIPRLTERLYRVDASRSRDTGGSGLGLAIVKHALDQHDAELEVSSREGRGSTFTCHFPLERISDIATTPAPP